MKSSLNCGVVGEQNARCASWKVPAMRGMLSSTSHTASGPYDGRLVDNYRKNGPRDIKNCMKDTWHIFNGENRHKGVISCPGPFLVSARLGHGGSLYRLLQIAQSRSHNALCFWMSG